MAANEITSAGTMMHGINRRTFVKSAALAGIAAGASGLGLGVCQAKAQADETTPSVQGYQYEAEQAEGQWIHSACSRNCFDTCMILSKVVDGQLVAVKGDPDNPFTKGGLCVKTQNYVDYVYNQDRILYPMKRTGTKGPGCTFERISWDEAIQTITDKWKEIIEAYGGEAITWHRYQGNQGAIQRRCLEPLFYKMGATYNEASLCNNGYVNSLGYTTGGITVMRAEAIAEKDLYVTWGHNAASCSLHTMKFVKEMNKNGGKIVVVNPVATPETAWADLFVQLKPGTDAAFALGVGKYLIDNGMTDPDFIEQYSIGYDEYADSCAEWDADRVAAECGIPAEQVAEFAEILWANRANACLKTGLNLGRRANGGMSHISVKLLTGLIGHPECYFNMTSSGGFNVNSAAMASTMLEGVTLPTEANPTGSIRNYSSPDLGKALTSQNYGEDHNFADNPLRSLFVFGSNPMVSNPNQNLIREGLEREDLFTIVHDIYVTPTVEYADIVLPAPTFFEYEEFNGGYGHNYDCYNNKVIEPLGECMDNLELCNRLGQAMGYDDPAFFRTYEDMRAMFLDGRSYSYEELAEKGWFDAEPKSWEAQLEEGFPTPSGKFQFACDELEHDHGTRTCVYTPDPENADPELLAKYPLALVNPGTKEFLNGIFGNMPDNVILFGESYVYMNTEDAEARGIEEGDDVLVMNDRGELHRKARVLDNVCAPGTVLTYKSTWSTVTGVENVNCVTTDLRADMGRGVAFQSCQVEVVKA